MRKQVPLRTTMGFKYTPNDGDGAALLKNLQPLENSLFEAKELEALQDTAFLSDLLPTNILSGVRKYVTTSTNEGYVYLIATEGGLYSIMLWDVYETNSFAVETIETFAPPYQRITLLPIHTEQNNVFPVLVCKSGTTNVNEIYYFKDGSWLTGSVPNKKSIFYPKPPEPYILMATLSKSEPVEYRYVITYSNEYTESPPSEVISFMGHRTPAETPLGKIGIYSSDTAIFLTPPKVNIYRWTSVVNAWFRIKTFDYQVGWEEYDTFPADYISEFVSPPFGQDTTISTDHVEDACMFAERTYLAVGNVLKVSKPNRFVFTPEPIEEEDVGYIRLPYRITNLFVWGNHVLALTDSGWYRIVENEGFMLALPVDFPLPANRDWIKETEVGIVVAQTDCVYLIQKDENIVRVGNVDWERVFRADRGVGREPLKVTTYERSGKRYLNIVYPVFRDQDYKVKTDLGFECIRVDLETGDVFIGTRVIPILEVR